MNSGNFWKTNISEACELGPKDINFRNQRKSLEAELEHKDDIEHFRSICFQKHSLFPKRFPPKIFYYNKLL